MVNIIARYISNNVHRMKPPVEPNREDCCNSGCNPCIFDVYQKQLELYKKYQECGEIPDEPKQNVMSQTVYTSFILMENVELCEFHHLLLFKVKVNENYKITWKPGDHFLVKYFQEGSSCTRAYTPIKLRLHGMEATDFSVIVKRYNNGLVSDYLCNLEQGDETLWRGPYGPYDVIPNKFRRIIMIAQGTGIAPFFSIIEQIVNNEDDMTKVILYYCCMSVDTILLRDYLYALKSYWNFTYTIFIKNCINCSSHCKYQEPIKNKKLCFRDLEHLKPFTLCDQFLICGSAKFMKEYQEWLEVEEGFTGTIVSF